MSWKQADMAATAVAAEAQKKSGGAYKMASPVRDGGPPEDKKCKFFDFKCYGEKLSNWWDSLWKSKPAPAPEVDAVGTQAVEMAQTSVAGMQTAQVTPSATATVIPVPASTALPTATPMFYPFTRMLVSSNGLNLRPNPSATGSVLEGSIPEGGEVYINRNASPIIADNYCWVQAKYKDPTINASITTAASEFLNPLTDFRRTANQGDSIAYNNGVDGWNGHHIGNDYMPISGGNPNPVIVASAPGKVIDANYQSGGYGNYIIIEYPQNSFSEDFTPAVEGLADGQSLYSIYGHLRDNIGETLPPGTHVKPGTEIGVMGSTGNSDQIHLHLELRAGEPDLDLNAFSGDWYDASKLVPVDPAQLVEPNDVFEGWVAEYSCDNNGNPTGEFNLEIPNE